MATRREQLAALAESVGPDTGPDTRPEEFPGTQEADSSEGGFPFSVLQGTGVSEPPPVKTRVKTPEESKGKKETPKPRGGTATERTLNEIAESLQEQFDSLSAYTSHITPVTSVYLAENSEKAVKALIGIGKRRPAVLKWISKAADGIDAVELGRFMAGVLTALQVDFGRLKGDELPARATGVTKILEEHFWEEEKPNPNLVFQAPQYVPV